MEELIKFYEKWIASTEYEQEDKYDKYNLLQFNGDDMINFAHEFSSKLNNK